MANEQNETTVPQGQIKRVGNNSTRLANILSSLSILVIIALAIIVMIGALNFRVVHLWGIFAGAMLFLLLGLGLKSQDRWYGFLIDPINNRVSLSKLQISLWSVMVLSAYIALALPRSVPKALLNPSSEQKEACINTYVNEVEGLSDQDWENLEEDEKDVINQRAEGDCNQPQPLKIVFPPQIIVALGISVASFAGSSMVKRSMESRQAFYIVTELKRKMDEAKIAFDSVSSDAERLSGDVQRYQELVRQNQASIDQEKAKPANEQDAEEIERLEKEINASEVLIGHTRKGIETLEPKLEELTKAYETAKQAWDIENLNRSGTLYVNKEPKDASLYDLFTGDVVGSEKMVDLSKVQMFFFTIIVIVSYTSVLYTLLLSDTTVMHPLGVELPTLSSSLNSLFAISHAGYITVKQLNQPERTME